MAPITRSQTRVRPYEGLGTTQNSLSTIIVKETEVVPEDVMALLSNIKSKTPLPKHVKDNYLHLLRYCEQKGWVVQTWNRAFVLTARCPTVIPPALAPPTPSASLDAIVNRKTMECLYIVRIPSLGKEAALLPGNKTLKIGQHVSVRIVREVGNCTDVALV
jgi:hypothetical protein